MKGSWIFGNVSWEGILMSCSSLAFPSCYLVTIIQGALPTIMPTCTQAKQNGDNQLWTKSSKAKIVISINLPIFTFILSVFCDSK